MKKLAKRIPLLLGMCVIALLCAITSLFLGGTSTAHAADEETTTVVEVKGLQHVSTVIEGYIYFDYTVEDTAGYDVTNEQRKLIYLNGESLYDIDKKYPTLFYWLQWRRDANTGERLMSLAIDETSPYSYIMGNSDGTPCKNTLTVKTGLVTVDGKRVTEDKTVEFNSIDQPVSLTRVGLLDQDSISCCYIGFEFNLPKRWAWESVPLDYYSSYIYVNGVQLSSLTDKTGIAVYWDHNFVPDHCIPGTDKLTFMINFSNNPIIKEGENTILLRKGMQIHWNVLGEGEKYDPTPAFWKLDKDYYITYNKIAGDSNNTVSINNSSITLDWDSLEVPETAAYGTDLSASLPASISTGEGKDTAINWANTAVPASLNAGETFNVIASADVTKTNSSVENAYKYYTVTIEKATPTVSVNPVAAGIVYGQTLAESALTGGTTSVEGKFAWADGTTTVSSVGTSNYDVIFTPTDTTNYNTVTISVPLEVSKVTPTVSVNPVAAALTYGQNLADSALTGGTASVAGTFAWADGTTVPTVENSGYEVIFTPTDSANYNTVTVAISVAKATPTVSVNPVAAALTYGQNLAESALTGGTASVAGTFAWAEGTTVPTVENSGYEVIFTPEDTANYETVTITVSVTVTESSNSDGNENPETPDGGCSSAMGASSVLFGIITAIFACGLICKKSKKNNG